MKPRTRIRELLWRSFPRTDKTCIYVSVLALQFLFLILFTCTCKCCAEKQTYDMMDQHLARLTQLPMHRVLKESARVVLAINACLCYAPERSLVLSQADRAQPHTSQPVSGCVWLKGIVRLGACFFRGTVNKNLKTRITASVLKQDPNTYKVQKSAVYSDKTWCFTPSQPLRLYQGKGQNRTCE